MNFNSRTHAIALALMGSAGLAAHWFLKHQDQIAAVAQFIVNHPVTSISSLTAMVLAALYNPSK